MALGCALVAPAGSGAGVPLGKKDGAIEYLRHVYPVRGPHGERGAVGEFQAPRSGGRIHEGFDILAACGTELVSAVTGKVREVGYDPILYGNYLLIHGSEEHRTYMYAHLKKPPRVHKGERVWAGERVGEVGKTRWPRMFPDRPIPETMSTLRRLKKLPA